MRKINKNKKRAFTLVEVMLALAIMALTIGVFFSLILVVMKSHSNVVATNDIADFAMLNAMAFENTVINAKTVGTGDKTISVKGNKLCVGNEPICDLKQYQVNPGPKDKWEMDFKCSISKSGYCEYTITLSDNADYTGISGMANHKGYTYNGCVYIPHAKATEVTDSSSFTYSDW